MSDENSYWLWNGGDPEGPMTMSELKALSENHELLPEAKVMPLDGQEWQELTEVGLQVPITVEAPPPTQKQDKSWFGRVKRVAVIAGQSVIALIVGLFGLAGAIADFASHESGLSRIKVPHFMEPTELALPASNPKLTAITAVYTASHAIPANQPSKKSAEEYIAQATAAYNKNNYVEAIGMLTAGIQDYPNNSFLYYDRALGKFMSNDDKGALEDVNKSLALDPKDADAYALRGMAELDQREAEKAVADAQHALQLSPNEEWAYDILALENLRKGSAEAAFTEADQAIKLGTNDSFAYCLRGEAELNEKNYDAAIADENRALELAPLNPFAAIDRGEAKLAQNDLDGAIASFDQELALNPEGVGVYFDRGYAKLMNGDFTGAVADLHEFNRLEPKTQNGDYALLYTWIANSQNGQGSLADSELSTALKTNWKAGPNDWTTKNAEFLLNRIPESDYLAAAASPNPGTARNQQCEAWYYAGMKKLLAGDPAAKDSFQKCLATGQTDFVEYQMAKVELAHLTPQGQPQAEGPVTSTQSK